MQKAVIQLETLTCPSCIKKIEAALSKVNGVENVKVLFHASKTKINFDEKLTTPDKLKQAIEKLGYQVQKIKTT